MWTLVLSCMESSHVVNSLARGSLVSAQDIQGLPERSGLDRPGFQAPRQLLQGRGPRSARSAACSSSHSLNAALLGGVGELPPGADRQPCGEEKVHTFDLTPNFASFTANRVSSTPVKRQKSARYGYWANFSDHPCGFNGGFRAIEDSVGEFETCCSAGRIIATRQREMRSLGALT
ncbi:hypothetical protein [Deinococcus aquaticus]|uniref:hypothetical protein n=1 Tax=Deinococcus aquaticus TaxID=328692 RepID=UPI003F47DE8F